MIRKLELTLAVLKPDILSKRYVKEEIKKIILKNNFYFIKSKTFKPTRDSMEKFYSMHKGILIAPISSYILARENAIVKWRELIGPTKHDKAIYEAPTSIRGRYGISDTRNAVHGSDSLESALTEIKFMFPEFHPEMWFKMEEPLFRKGQDILYDSELEVHYLNKSSHYMSTSIIRPSNQ
ncbi:nucleoside diphosphate kinase 6-like isoform X2 [Gordionus sp. m RMFG-2023]|uniref:nucleoside diphosphate kinase 6-like isoform X2 n=1 Tax=Gordionus sp. m RMFG-2023 TaxID=3053472 RepID=UPI0031FC53CF